MEFFPVITENKHGNINKYDEGSNQNIQVGNYIEAAIKRHIRRGIANTPRLSVKSPIKS